MGWTPTEPWPNLWVPEVGFERSFGYELHRDVYEERRTKTEPVWWNVGRDLIDANKISDRTPDKKISDVGVKVNQQSMTQR